MTMTLPTPAAVGADGRSRWRAPSSSACTPLSSAALKAVKEVLEAGPDIAATIDMAVTREALWLYYAAERFASPEAKLNLLKQALKVIQGATGSERRALHALEAEVYASIAATAYKATQALDRLHTERPDLWTADHVSRYRELVSLAIRSVAKGETVRKQAERETAALSAVRARAKRSSRMGSDCRGRTVAMLRRIARPRARGHRPSLRTRTGSANRSRTAPEDGSGGDPPDRFPPGDWPQPPADVASSGRIFDLWGRLPLPGSLRRRAFDHLVPMRVQERAWLEIPERVDQERRVLNVVPRVITALEALEDGDSALAYQILRDLEDELRAA